MDEKEDVITITDLIERDPRTRLNGTYKSALLNKIKETFTGVEQQLYVTSFYCYLNYDSEKDFVIDFDDVWKWCGFARKDHAKTLLKKHFIQDVDYKVEIGFAETSAKPNDPKISDDEKEDLGEKNKKIGGAKFDPEISGDEKDKVEEKKKKIVGVAFGTKAAPAIAGAAFVPELTGDEKEEKNKGGAGLNKKRIILTVDTFKKFCMKAGTKKADEIHTYYIKLEKLLHKTMQEQSQELQLQLENKQEQLEKKQLALEEAHEKEEEQTRELEKKEKLIKKLQRQKQVVEGKKVVYLCTTDEKEEEGIFGIGKAMNLEKRLGGYNDNKLHNFKIVKHISCKSRQVMDAVETILLAKMNPYKIVSNRDVFQLPEGKDVTFFTQWYDSMNKFCEDIEEDIALEERTEKEIQELLEEIKEEMKEDKSEYNKEYRQNHHEEILEREKNFREDNKEHLKEVMKDYAFNNQEKVAQLKANYREEHKEEIKERMKIYRKENADKIAATKKKYNEEHKETYQEKIKCACGSTVSRQNMSYHLGTDRHTSFVNTGKSLAEQRDSKKVKCVCGMTVANLKRHQTSKLHQNFIETQKKESTTISSTKKKSKS